MTLKERITHQMDEAEARILDGMDSLEGRMVDMNARTADALHDVRVNTPDVELPFSPENAVARYYDFAGKVLESNRKFVQEIVKVWYPAPKKAAKKAPAKKATAK